MIQVLQKAASVLDLVAADSGMTFTAIREATGMNKATLSHLLKSLMELGYLERQADGTHVIGAGIVRLSRRRLGRETLHGVAQQSVRQLAEELGETVTVGMLHHGERFNLAKASVDRSVSVDSRVEQRFSPYETATGRVLLAFCSPQELATVVERKGLPCDWEGVRSRGELDAALTAIRTAGRAVLVAADGHAESVAVPVFRPGGELCASIGVAAPCYRLSEERRGEIFTALVRAREHMEHVLTAYAGGSTEVTEA